MSKKNEDIECETKQTKKKKHKTLKDEKHDIYKNR